MANILICDDQADVVSALHLRSVPATVILSVLITFSWFVSVVGMQLVARALPALASHWLSALVLVVAPVLALPLTSIAARPLAKVTPQARLRAFSSIQTGRTVGAPNR